MNHIYIYLFIKQSFIFFLVSSNFLGSGSGSGPESDKMPEPSSPAEFQATGSGSSGTGAGAPAELLVSLQETVSLAHAVSLPALASLLRRLTIAVHSLPPSESVIEPMAADLRRLSAVMRSSVGAEPSEVVSEVREVVRDLGRSLGILMLEPAGVRDGMAALHREMMAARFEGPEGRWGGPVPDLEEAVVRIKSGEEMEGAIAELGFLVREVLVREEDGPGVVSVLVNRLGSVKDGNRLRILSLLRSLAALSEENKVESSHFWLSFSLKISIFFLINW